MNTPMLRSLCARLLLAAASAAAPLTLSAQQPKPIDPALEAILTTLEDNLTDYNRSVPSFLCNEHVSSEMEPTHDPGGSKHIVTDSVFRVRRAPAGLPDQPRILESRILKAVDGKPVTTTVSDDAALPMAPMAVFGIFSNGLNLVSASATDCFHYRLHPARRNHPADRIVIDFDELPVGQRTDDCPTNGKISGRASIQQSTLRILHLETKTRDHESQIGIKETWEWSIDYAPVQLSGKTFWMPATIRSKAVPDANAATDLLVSPSRRGGPGTGGSQGRPVTYTLNARYSDYHLLNVTSRIVPASETDGNPPAAPAPAPAPQLP